MSHIGWGGEQTSIYKAQCLTLKSFVTAHVMSHIGWGGEQTSIYKGVETFL